MAYRFSPADLLAMRIGHIAATSNVGLATATDTVAGNHHDNPCVVGYLPSAPLSDLDESDVLALVAITTWKPRDTA